MPKGGAKIGEHVLFGKYRLCRKLGAGRSGNVFLAWHTELEEYRAVKIVPKTMADYETFRKEALFLKTLRHPGIPLVYDVGGPDKQLSYRRISGRRIFICPGETPGQSVNENGG